MNFVGEICPFCENLIEKTDDIVICSKCNKPHHKVCWNANHGCTTYLCYGTMLTPKDFEEPEFYKPIKSTLVEDDSLEISKADGSQFADFYGGKSEKTAVFQGVRGNINQSGKTENNGERLLTNVFPQKTEEELEKELRAKLKEEIKAELQAEIKMKPATALICERCGASLPIVENLGKMVCPSCMTEYILNNENGQKILTEIHFENPFIVRIVDPDLNEIKEYLELGGDYTRIFKKLISTKAANAHKFGYWTLRLRAYTEDFQKIFNDYKDFDEVFLCINEHLKLYSFEEDEKDYIDKFFQKSRYAFDDRLSELKAESEKAEKKIIELKAEEQNLINNIKFLYSIINNPKSIRNNTKKENESVYKGHTVCIISTIVLGVLVILTGITIILIPLALLNFVMQLVTGILIYVLYDKERKLEEEYVMRTCQQISKLESRKNFIKDSFTKNREICVKCFYEYKQIKRVISFRIWDLK